MVHLSGPLGQILRILGEHPKTAAELEGQLGSSSAALQGMLSVLERGGYIREHSVKVGCSHCNLKSLCPIPNANPSPSYGLTAKGLGLANGRQCSQSNAQI